MFKTLFKDTRGLYFNDFLLDRFIHYFMWIKKIRPEQLKTFQQKNKCVFNLFNGCLSVWKTALTTKSSNIKQFSGATNPTFVPIHFLFI